MRDFTLDSYRALLETLSAHGYRFLTFEAYCERRMRGEDAGPRFVILRHDVDKLPANSLRTAEIEHALGIRATYYFRLTESTETLRARVDGLGSEGSIGSAEDGQAQYVKAIAGLGHEVGYHYEDLSLTDGDTTQAYVHFEAALAYLRTFYPVRTICMHGAPTSKWDGKDLWKHYDYRASGIIGEPYFDTPFGEVFYLTDTGRCWDGYRYSVRDRIEGKQEQWVAQGLEYHSTSDIIRSVADRQFPSRLMITTHPQRWTNNRLAWWKEAVLQTIKNQVKQLIIKQH